MMPANREPRSFKTKYLCQCVFAGNKDEQPQKVVMKEGEDEELSYEGIRDDKNKKISTDRVKGSSLMTC